MLSYNHNRRGTSGMGSQQQGQVVISESNFVGRPQEACQCNLCRPRSARINVRRRNSIFAGYSRA